MTATVAKKSEKVESQPKKKCPTGMKLPGWVKRMTSGKTKAERRGFMRSMGIALHEASQKVRSANSSAAKSNKRTSGTDSE